MIRVRIGSDEHELSWDEWERRVRDGRVPPDALVQFEAVTGDTWQKADELELYRSLRNDAAIAWRGAFTSGPPPLLTALLVGVQVRVWWFARVDVTQDWLLSHFTNWTGPALENGEVWRPVTMGFLHVDLFHLVLNMLWLAYTGWNIERALGRRNLLTIYVASVVGGALLSMFGSPQTPSLGASGGVFGLVAASTVFGFVRPELLPQRGRRLFGAAMLPYLALMFWSGLMNDDTDNWSHFGGLMVGAFLAFVLDPAPLQRRPGWNARFQGGLVAAILLSMAVGWSAGPRLMPLVDSEVARVQANPRRTKLPADLEDRALRWTVPAGWRPARDLTDMPGFASRAGERSFGVREREADTLLSTEDLAAAWWSALLEDWPDAASGPLTATTLAGRPALTRSVQPDPRQGTVVQWTGVARGVHTLEAVWVVETDRADRLAPMHRRLEEAVRWADPSDLVRARADVAFTPRSADARQKLAEALGRIGDTTESMRLHRELVDERPSDPDRWVAWLDTAALGGVSAEAQNELWTGAVAATAASSVLTAVATDLAAAGRVDDARGLLELAWWQRPGDRRLRRARKRLGLPVALTSTGQPWSRVFDPLTGRARPEPLPVPTERTLPAATVLGQALAARAAAVDAATCEAIRTHDAAALWPLLLWQRDGELPGPDSDAPQAILEELTEPDRAAWMSDPVRSCTTNDLSIWLGAAPPPRADLPG